MTGLPKELRQNHFCMKALARYTKLHPSERMNKIREITSRLDEKIRNYGLSVKERETAPTVQGYIINRPTITLGNKN
jgi:hypothetical protein